MTWWHCLVPVALHTMERQGRVVFVEGRMWEGRKDTQHARHASAVLQGTHVLTVGLTLLAAGKWPQAAADVLWLRMGPNRRGAGVGKIDFCPCCGLKFLVSPIIYTALAGEQVLWPETRYPWKEVSTSLYREIHTYMHTYKQKMYSVNSLQLQS